MTYVKGFAVWHIQSDIYDKMLCGKILEPARTSNVLPERSSLCYNCKAAGEKADDVKKGRLTDKELAILTDLATTAGSNEEIAKRYHITPGTVRTHLQNIQLALGLHSKVELVVYFWTQLYRRDDEPGRG